MDPDPEHVSASSVPSQEAPGDNDQLDALDAWSKPGVVSRLVVLFCRQPHLLPWHVAPETQSPLLQHAGAKLAMQVPLQSLGVEPEQPQLPAEHVFPPVHAAWSCQEPSEPHTWGTPELLHCGALPGLQLPVQPADGLQT